MANDPKHSPAAHFDYKMNLLMYICICFMFSCATCHIILVHPGFVFKMIILSGSHQTLVHLRDKTDCCIVCMTLQHTMHYLYCMWHNWNVVLFLLSSLVKTIMSPGCHYTVFTYTYMYYPQTPKKTSCKLYVLHHQLIIMDKTLIPSTGWIMRFNVKMCFLSCCPSWCGVAGLSQCLVNFIFITWQT